MFTIIRYVSVSFPLAEADTANRLPEAKTVRHAGCGVQHEKHVKHVDRLVGPWLLFCLLLAHLAPRFVGSAGPSEYSE